MDAIIEINQIYKAIREELAQVGERLQQERLLDADMGRASHTTSEYYGKWEGLNMASSIIGERLEELKHKANREIA